MSNMGFIRLYKGAVGVTEYMKEQGPDLMGWVDPNYWHQVIRRKNLHRKSIGAFLLEQKYFSGIGNYLRAEILYYCRISPHRLLPNLDDREIALLLQVSQKVISDSYAQGGHTEDTYLSLYGNPGMYPCVVYGHSVDPYGNYIKKDKMDKRTIWWCPAMQN